MAATAARAVTLGAQAIDINFGCPAPTVNRHDGGATLLRYPERLEAIVSEVRSAVPATIPVSAKLRLGWDDPRAIIVNAERVERGGASWITIHGRTRMQGYTPPAYWGPIGQVRRALGIPVVANGEIWCREDLERCHEQTGAVHFMLGRGVLAEPGLVQECARALGLAAAESATTRCANDPRRWWSTLQTLITAGLSHGVQERYLLARIKQWLGYAHRRGTISWFDRVKRVEHITQLAESFARLSESSNHG
jgi:tRNA-dihydrouridine synthase C